ncbi:probable jasmonic acid carboxyl methyltransferase 2 [Diospyros lotus]|uniref:probable jasmonic acid carboxyl methyltransferase 2 n=1 Tax=Diospyros lotus TaxID=55363 RepID=UPI002255ABF5|nr:probable jasmonic acid carboxyl methyltransferase 2 [Diospyros lotus]
MEVVQVLHMNEGDGKTSYTTNSSVQKQAMLKAKHMLEESITELCNSGSFPECIRMVDLGCSSGPNTLQLVKQTIETVNSICKRLNREIPTFQVFLNDLPGNDFNVIFRSLPSFYEQLDLCKDKCFIAAMPGSFYGRLFPDNFLHFVHSSYSLHWRSHVPEGLRTQSGSPLNKENIYISKTSPPSVREKYLDAFRKDFRLFLSSRSAEMVAGGLLFFTMVATDDSGGHRSTVWELIGITIHDMVLEGLIEESKLASFDLPYYAPTMEEVRQVAGEEGSFELQSHEAFRVAWDSSGYAAGIGNGHGCTRGKRVAMNIRAVGEPMLASHFGVEMMDGLFERFAAKMDEHLKLNDGLGVAIAISMTKK